MMALLSRKATQSWVNREYRVLRTLSWRTHVFSVVSQCGGGDVANPHSLWFSSQEVQDPIAEGGVQIQGSELGVELGRNNSVEY
jgi:hypothetical protein